MTGRHAARPRHSRRSRTLVAVGVGAALLVGAAAGADGALHSSLFGASHVTVLGARHESVASVERVAGLDGAPPLVDVDPGAIASRLAAAFPWIDTVSVSTSWPHSVTITITERRAVAEVRTSGGKWELVDETGRRLGPPAAHETLPHLSFAAPPIDQRLPNLPAQAIPGLYVAATLPPAFAWEVRSIDVDAQGWVTLELTTPVTFVLGPAVDLRPKYEDVAAVIGSTTLHTGDVVDVSVPQAMTVSGP